MPAHYDYIFAGGGLSALLLAYLIRREPALADRSILLVDPQRDNPESRNICFWATELPNLPLELKGAWSHLTFGGAGGTLKAAIAPYTYYCLDAAALQRKLTAELAASPLVTFIDDRVLFTEGDTVVLGKTMQYVQARRYVFDSIPDTNGPVPLWQHFLGWEIEIADGGELDDTAATLMDFSVSQQDGPAFMYILPFSNQRALVEMTFMSPRLPADQHYEKYLQVYLQEKYPHLKYTITRTERGKIPMHQPRPAPAVAKQIRLGIKGGQAKATTGYTFLNSYQHALNIVALLKGEATRVPSTPVRFEFYDRLLLSIIRREPQRVKPIMEALFNRNSFPALLSFLAEKSTLWQEARLFLTLPWIPFLKALIYEYAPRPAGNEAQPAADRAVRYPAQLEVQRSMD
jgi:lycopene beta-cyclase